MSTRTLAALTLALAAALAASASPAAAAISAPASVAHFGSPSSASPLVKRQARQGVRTTFYDPGLGACGKYNVASDFIVALNQPQFGYTPGRSDWCWAQITVSYAGRSTCAQIVDMCPSCPNGGLDVSPSLFKYLADDLGKGVIAVDWWPGCAGQAPPRQTTTTWTPPPATTVPPPPPKPATTTTVPPPAKTEEPPAKPAAPVLEQVGGAEWRLGTPMSTQLGSVGAAATPAPEAPKPVVEAAPKPAAPAVVEAAPAAPAAPATPVDADVAQATREHLTVHAERVAYLQELFNKIVASMYKKSSAMAMQAAAQQQQ